MKIRIALCQINPTLGDIGGNASLIENALKSAQSNGASIAVFPELCICGCPPEELVFRSDFVARQREAAEGIASACRRIAAVAGFIDEERGRLYNAAAVMAGGRIAAVYRKTALSGFDFFDENRCFAPGGKALVLRLDRFSAAVNICGDILADGGVMDSQCLAGDARLVMNISASPYHAGKLGGREELVSRRAREHSCFLAHVNLVGGQDGLVFEGGSVIAAPDGSIINRAALFAEDAIYADVDIEESARARQGSNYAARQASFKPPMPVAASSLGPLADPKGKPLPARRTPAPPAGIEEEVYGALVLGTRDYVLKNGFADVALGVSGGVDSALVSVVAADALGPDRVHGVAMPSRYSSKGSLDDARALASNIGIRLMEVPIEKPFAAFLDLFSDIFSGMPEDTTEENIQARIRGNIMMALSNKHGWLVLTTGNKSESSVGYCTLYGDTAGGFAVIKDVFKTFVYRLAEWRNARGPVPVIPRSILEKAPSAELKPGQTDQDSLPPYALLDPILEAYVEKNLPAREIPAWKTDPSLVKRVINMVDRSEFKRRQSPPGVRITPLTLVPDQRPLTCRFRP